MLRLVEIALFLAPFALVLAWWLAGARASPRVLAIACVALLVLGGFVVWFGLDRSLPRDARYVPARIEDGRIVSGHAAPRGATP
jgi:hypothetical protein